MFLFNSLHQRNPKVSRSLRASGSLRRLCARSVFTFAILFVAVWFNGCKTDTDEEFILEGVWTGFGDSYTITKTSVHYAMDESEWEGTIYPGMKLKGVIEKTEKFTNNAGVLIIKVTEATTGNTVEKYTGVYYSEGTKSSVKMGNAVDENNDPIEEDTLDKAQSTFTVDNVDSHISYWGNYTK